MVVELKMTGEVRGIVNKEYKGTLTKKVQFMMIDAERGIQVTELKLPESFDVSKIKIGTKITRIVLPYVFEKKIFYKAENLEITK